MNYDSLIFLIFLIISFTAYWACPARFRWGVILGASYWFYASWDTRYVLLLMAITVISYFSALSFEHFHENLKLRRLILIVSLIVCFGVLVVFKYFNFFAESFGQLMNTVGLPVHITLLEWVLPVGISFYCFQAAGYIIDVYKGKYEAERHFGVYAAFMSFFPQILSGPIARGNQLLPQLKKEHGFSYDNASYGVKRIVLGAFKEYAIADFLSQYITKVFDNPGEFPGFSLLCAMVLFSIQIYCDFSGYSDMMIGLAKLFDINLMENFHNPYFATSLKEFGSRVHISLSTWFRDYLYIPMGGNRKHKNINLLVTFTVSGLWHGANWTFILWGFTHGLAQVLEKKFVKPTESSLKRFLGMFIVFIFCTIEWTIFKASSLKDAFYIMIHAFDGITGIGSYIMNGLVAMGMDLTCVGIIVLTICALTVIDIISEKEDIILWISRKPVVVRWTAYIMLVVFILLVKPVNNTDFLYFQF